MFQGLERQTDLPSPVFAPETEPSFTIFFGNHNFFGDRRAVEEMFEEPPEEFFRGTRYPQKRVFQNDSG